MRQQHQQQINLTALCAQILRLAECAGRAIMQIYRQDNAHVAYKEDQSPVTEADRAAHQVLATGLAGLIPGCPVVSEEDDTSMVYRQDQGRFWLIDPLDGTKEFIARNDEFTVNIALIDNGRPVLGVVYAPALDCIYWGGADFGAFRDQSGTIQTIRVETAKVTRHRVVASKSHLNAETQAFIERLGKVNLVQAGSSLKFCRVAEGAADIYPRLAPTCEWDTAAAQAVLEGAGGVVTDLHGHPLSYGKPEVLNPPFIGACSTAWLAK